RGQEPRAATANARPEPPAGDVLLALPPAVVRRHRLLGVLLDQGGERAQVVPLEGLDVARKELLSSLVHFRYRIVRADAARLQRLARALQRAVDRCHASVEELGDLLGFPAEDFAQDQRGALPGREMLERRHEGETDRLPRDRQLGRINSLREDAVRARLPPG